MPVISASVDFFILAACLSLAFIVYSGGFSHILSDSSGTFASPTSAKPRRRRLIALLLFVHTLYILYQLLVLSPQNLFTTLNISPTAPSEKIRKRLLESASSAGATIPEHLEALLKRLGSHSVRQLYHVLGHNSIAECEHCYTREDFALYHFAHLFTEYVREITVAGLVTIRGTNHERLRFVGLSALMFAAMAEIYYVGGAVWLQSLPMGEEISFHFVVTVVRRLIFLALPIVLHLWPLKSRPDATRVGEALQRTHAIRQLATKLRFLQYLNGAAMRIPQLRENVGSWWTEEGTEGLWIRQDEEVQRVARGVGLVYADDEDAAAASSLRAKAMAVVNVFWSTLNMQAASGVQ